MLPLRITAVLTFVGTIFLPCDNTWTFASMGANVPAERVNQSGVWTDQERIVWGGVTSSGEVNSGDLYYPSAETTPTIAISPTSGPAGQVVTVTGSGFAPSNSAVSLNYDGNRIRDGAST